MALMRPALLGGACHQTSLLLFRTAAYGTKGDVRSEASLIKNDTSKQRIENFRASDVEFCPTRQQEVMENAVTINAANSNDPSYCSTPSQEHGENKDHREELDVYLHRGSISLYSVMQSNVPEPFRTKGKAPTHLNMPGGSWGQGYKYVAGDIKQTHQSGKFKT